MRIEQKVHEHMSETSETYAIICLQSETKGLGPWFILSSILRCFYVHSLQAYQLVRLLLVQLGIALYTLHS